jgi:hypothetical protein
LSLSDDTLMAYVDGELEEDKRAAVAQAVATDPEVARRVAEQRLLRASLQTAFSGVLDEPVPEHLVRAARTAPAGDAHPDTVADLASKRAAKRLRLRRVLPQWGAIAASLVLGVLIGERFLGSGEEGFFVTQRGQLLAHGALARALTAQLASSQAANANVQIGVSFRAHSGEYCRTFSLSRDGGNGSALAGLACRSRRDWHVDVLARSAPEGSGAYREAGSAMPSAVSQAMDAAIAGAPLDADGERAARDRAWQP